MNFLSSIVETIRTFLGFDATPEETKKEDEDQPRKPLFLHRFLVGLKGTVARIARRVLVTALDIATDGKESKLKRVFNALLFSIGVYLIFTHITLILGVVLIFLFISSLVASPAIAS